jgi:hypothetical protein
VAEQRPSVDGEPVPVVDHQHLVEAVGARRADLQRRPRAAAEVGHRLPQAPGQPVELPQRGQAVGGDQVAGLDAEHPLDLPRRRLVPQPDRLARQAAGHHHPAADRRHHPRTPRRRPRQDQRAVGDRQLQIGQAQRDGGGARPRATAPRESGTSPAHR